MIKKLSLIFLFVIPGEFVLAAKAYTPFSPEGRLAIVKRITSKSRKDSLSSLREIEKSVGIVRSKLYANHHKSCEALKTALRNNDVLATQGWLTVLFASPALEGLSREEIRTYDTFLAQGKDLPTKKMFQDFRVNVLNELSEHLLLYPDKVTQKTNGGSMVGAVLRSLKAVGMEEPFVKLFVKQDLLSKGEGDLSFHFRERCVRDILLSGKFLPEHNGDEKACAEIDRVAYGILPGYNQLIQRIQADYEWNYFDECGNFVKLAVDVENSRERLSQKATALYELQKRVAAAMTHPSVQPEKGSVPLQDNGQKTVEWLSM